MIVLRVEQSREARCHRTDPPEHNRSTLARTGAHLLAQGATEPLTVELAEVALLLAAPVRKLLSDVALRRPAVSLRIADTTWDLDIPADRDCVVLLTRLSALLSYTTGRATGPAPGTET